MDPKELDKEKKVKEKEMESIKEKQSKQALETGKKHEKTVQEETKKKFTQILDTTRVERIAPYSDPQIRRRDPKMSGASPNNVKFCYKGVDYSIFVPSSITEPLLCKHILHVMILELGNNQELNRRKQYVFLPEIDVQAKSFLTKGKNGKSHLSIPDGYIIPVLAVEVDRSYAPSNSVDLTTRKSVIEFMDKLNKGQYADKETLIITASSKLSRNILVIENLNWEQLKRVLLTVMVQPFPHLHTITLNRIDER